MKSRKSPVELDTATIQTSVLARVEAEIEESPRLKETSLRQCSFSVTKISVAIAERLQRETNCFCMAMVDALWMDFKILAKTIPAVIKGAGAP